MIPPTPVENIHMRSEFKAELNISAVRMPDLHININVTPILQGWKTIDYEKRGREDVLKDWETRQQRENY